MAAKKRGAKKTGGARGKLTEYRRKRDFRRTSEPSGEGEPTLAPARGQRGHLRFVIQKHAASHLHFDLRLELDGVMKSWAVPKGPDLDPKARRLAMQVEDHPIGYNTFEGTIPAGEYGGGTVMIWDQGTYYPDEAPEGADHEETLRKEFAKGKLSITFEGERLQGSFALVRTDRGAKPKWLLIKHRDHAARPGYDIVEDIDTSVVSGRTMDEIAHGDSAVWRSNRGPGSGRKRAAKKATPDVAQLAIEPMLPTPRKRIPEDGFTFEPAYGGQRAIAYVTPEAATLLNGKGLELGSAHASIARALQAFSKRVKQPFVLDGEVWDGAYHVFDLLLLGDAALLGEPWHERRERLEQLFERRRVPSVEVAPSSGDADEMSNAAEDGGWAGIRGRTPDGTYRPGVKSRDWIEIAR